MARIKTDSLQPGMVVEADVRNIDGMLLAPGGSSLTDRHIRILQAWGISEIEVVAPEGTEEPADALASLPPEVLAEWTAEAKGRFWELDETSPVAMEVFDLMLHRKAARNARR